MAHMPVGAGLLANASGRSVKLLNDTPLSRASPLPQEIQRSQGGHFAARPADEKYL